MVKTKMADGPPIVIEALSKAQENQLQRHLERIDEAKAGFNESVVTIGRELVAIKSILPAKEFVPWVKKHCRLSRSTAYNYINAFERFGNFPRLENFEAKALYLLAPSEEASKKAKELASKGQIIDEEKANGLLGKSKPAKGKPSASPTVGLNNGKAGENGEQPAASSNGAADGHSNASEAVDSNSFEGSGSNVNQSEGESTREPGDDTEALKAEQAKRRASGKELVSPKERKEAVRAFGAVVRFIDKLKRHDELRQPLQQILSVIEGKA